MVVASNIKKLSFLSRLQYTKCMMQLCHAPFCKWLFHPSPSPPPPLDEISSTNIQTQLTFFCFMKNCDYIRIKYSSHKKWHIYELSRMVYSSYCILVTMMHLHFLHLFPSTFEIRRNTIFFGDMQVMPAVWHISARIGLIKLYTVYFTKYNCRTTMLMGC